MLDCEDKAVEGGRWLLGVSRGTGLFSLPSTWSGRFSGAGTVVVSRPAAMYVLRLQVSSHAIKIVCKSCGVSVHTFATYHVSSFTELFPKFCSR